MEEHEGSRGTHGERETAAILCAMSCHDQIHGFPRPTCASSDHLLIGRPPDPPVRTRCCWRRVVEGPPLLGRRPPSYLPNHCLLPLEVVVVALNWGRLRLIRTNRSFFHLLPFQTQSIIYDVYTEAWTNAAAKS